MFDFSVFERPIISMEEMKKQKELLKEVYAEFDKHLNKILKMNNGVCDQHDINRAIKKAKKEFPLTKYADDVVEAFFDTYVGAWQTFGDRDGARAFADKIFND